MARLTLDDLAPEDQAALPEAHPLRQVVLNSAEKKMAMAVAPEPPLGDGERSKRLSALGQEDSTPQARSAQDVIALEQELKTQRDPGVRSVLQAEMDKLRPPAVRGRPSAATGLSAADLDPADRAKLRKNDPLWMDPTEGMSSTQRALAGAGKFFSDTGSGLRQVAANVLNPIGQALSGKDILDKDYAGEAERRYLDESLMNTVGGNVGYMGAGALSLALPGAVATQGAARLIPAVAGRAAATYAPVAASSAAMSTLTPTTADGERAENAGVSAVLGPAFQVGAQAVGRAVRPAAEWIGRNVSAGPLLRKSWSSGATPDQQRVVGTAIDNGIPVYPRQLEKPGIDVGRGRAEHQLDRFSTAMNRTMGEETGDIGSAFGNARTRLSNTYGTLLDGKVIPLNTMTQGATPGAPPVNKFVDKLIAIRDTHNAGSPIIEPSRDLNDAIERALSYVQSHGTLTGRQYQDLLRNYAASANQAAKGNILLGTKSNPSAMKGFSDLSEAIAQQAELVMTPAEVQAFRTANRQFRNMKTLESLAPTKVDGQADFNPAAVARKLARSDKDAFLYGRGDTTQSDLSKFGATYMGLDANAPNSLLQRSKDMMSKSAPILIGDTAGAIIAGKALGVEDMGDNSLPSQALKYGALLAAIHGARTGTRAALNPAVTASQLVLPRGALSEVMQRVNPAASVNAAAGYSE